MCNYSISKAFCLNLSKQNEQLKLKSENSWFPPYTRTARNSDRNRIKTTALKIETKYKRNTDTQRLWYTEWEDWERNICESYPHTNIHTRVHIFTVSTSYKHTLIHIHKFYLNEKGEQGWQKNSACERDGEYSKACELNECHKFLVYF